ncbi:MAG TPA: ABC transporter substrate-binding protein [Actinomycetota bacterium]|nr:ABC transporter substrate-binding protein [Actinomycetota bacterium]
MSAPHWVGAGLVLLFAGCTTPTDAPTTTVPSGSTVVSTPDATPTAPEIFEEGAEILDVAIRQPATLDPLRIGDPGSMLVARQLYEGLTRWDPLAEEVQPAAAESWSTSDGRTFVFKLRAGMTFHDGSPVEAQHFAYAFDRIALKENASEIAYALEGIIGFHEVNGAGTASHLAGVTTPDPLTLSIELVAPYHELPAVMTHPALVPLHPAAVADYDSFLAEPVGNGPFRMAAPWIPGGPVALMAFAGFYETPEADGIRFLPYPDAAASWLQFRDGLIDVAEVPAGQTEDASAMFGEQGFTEFASGYYFGFNLDSPDLRDPRLRAGINRAIDREAIARDVFAGSMSPARGIVPAGLPGFQENVCVDICDYDPDAARRVIGLLPRAERRVAIQYTEGDPHEQVARMVKRDLEAVGLEVTLRGFRFSRYVDLLNANLHTMYRMGWLAEYPVADVFLTPLFSGKSPDNHSSFSSVRVDRLLTEAHAEPSPGRRAQLYIAAEKAILKEMPIVPIGSYETHWAVQGAVDGIVFDVMGGFDAFDVSVEGDAER